MPRACAIVSMVTAIGAATAMGVVGACEEKKPPPPAATTDASIASAPHPSTSVVASAPPSIANPAKKPAACAVAYVSYPPTEKPPLPGDDLSAAPVPVRVPAGGSLTISMRHTGHEVTVQGPAVVRPCTHDEPDVLLIASGHASTNETSPVRPGSEIFIATPSLVAVVARATIDLAVSAEKTGWILSSGDAKVTTLDATKSPKNGEKGAEKRFSDGGLLLTRCGVQATATANAERLLAQYGSDAGADAPAPLPSASIGTLAAEEIKHARERVLDCGFAEAFALSCDELKPGKGPAPASSGCKGGYDAVQTYLAKAVASTTLPPGSPPPSP